MKELNLSRLTNMANIAAKLLGTGQVCAIDAAKPLLGLIKAETSEGGSLKSMGITDVPGLRDHFADANIASGCASQGEPAVSVGESYLSSLEQDRLDLRRLVALIGLHDGTVAISAQAATSALTAEIGELIAKHKA